MRRLSTHLITSGTAPFLAVIRRPCCFQSATKSCLSGTCLRTALLRGSRRVTRDWADADSCRGRAPGAWDSLRSLARVHLKTFHNTSPAGVWVGED